MRILLNVDMTDRRRNEILDIHYLDSGRTNFSPVSCLSMPVPGTPLYAPPEVAFSTDGSKFAVAVAFGGMSVWDIRNKFPFQILMELHWPKNVRQRLYCPRFSSGNLGKEILVFAEVRLMFTF